MDKASGVDGAGEGPAPAAAVLDRLARIEALDRDGAPVALLLDELRALVWEAETWTKSEGGDAGTRATTRLRSALAAERPAAGMIAV
jgi:hypothetical protein